jgi:uncharacterized protein YceH (UPF0502 family)
MENELPLLSAVEQRVLGTLIEKSKTTPDYYPMTLNALTAGCNQKTSRKPVVDYDESTVSAAIQNLKGQDLVATAIGGGSRTVKFKHNFLTRFELLEAELAVICLLLLRGPQTPGELNTNAARLHEFKSLESVHETLNGLMKAEPPFVRELPRRPGQKEARFIHLLGETADTNEENLGETYAGNPVNNLEQRVSTLERELNEVKLKLESLVKELMG